MAKKNVTERKMKREISFKLTEADRANLGNTLAKLNGEYGDIEKDFSKVRKEFKSKLDVINMQVDLMSRCLREGEQRRTVDVVERKDFNKRMVQYVHNGTVVEEREMTGDELQTELPLEAPRKTNELSQVITLETKKKTKKSALDLSV